MKNPSKLAFVALGFLLLVGLAVQRFTAPGNSVSVAPAPSEQVERTSALTEAPPEPDDSRVAQGESATGPLAPSAARFCVIDETNGEPVPFLALSVQGADGAREEVVSDARGCVTLAARAGAITLEIRGEASANDLVQSQRAPARLKGEPIAIELRGEDPLDVPVPVGPTWRLSVSGGPDVERTRFTATLSSADASKAFDKVHAPLRVGADFDGPWIRFGPLARLVAPGPPWRIRLVSEDGLWTGQALVESNSGVQRLPLSILLEAKARLAGRVLDSARKPVANQWMQLWPPGGTFDDPAKRPLLALTSAAGEYRFDGVAPGPYTLKTTLKGHAEFESSVELASLQAARLDVELARPPGARSGRVAGRVRSQSGAYAGPLKAALQLREPPSLESTPVVWEDTPEGKLGRFVFEDVSEDGPGVYLFGPELFAFEPAKRTAAPFSEEELLFTVLDAAPAVELAFEARVPGTEARVPKFELFVQTHLDTNPRRTTLRAEGGSTRVRGISAGARYTWRLRAEGFAPTWGEDVAPASDAVVVLEPRTGFGLEIVASDAAGQALEGARVSFDGVELAVTDAAGIAHVHAERAPERIHIVWKDWIPAEKSAVRADGAWKAWQDSVSVVLEPPR